MVRRRLGLAVVTVVTVVAGTVAGCGSSAPSTAPTPTSSPAGPDGAGTVWLCRPGQRRDPCTADLTATVVTAGGGRTTVHPRPAAHPAVDCFYVYPTVSRQATLNADLHIDPEESQVARIQASPFSQACRVYAPMYRQLTLAAIGSGARSIDPRAEVVAFQSVLSAWKDYLAHDNHGRGVVLIGHSQGAAMLTGLLRREIDDDPGERRLLVSAILLGGNVTVPVGGTVGGDFVHVPACRANGQTGCVVAYSSFETPPPPDSFFGRVDTAIGGRVTPATANGGAVQVLCTNPASLSGGTGSLDPYFFTGSRAGGGSSSTAHPAPWVAYPDRYSATCTTAGGATWLQVDPAPDPPDARPQVSQSLGPRWGLHLADVNLALGNLVALVKAQSAAYTRSGA